MSPIGAVVVSLLITTIGSAFSAETKIHSDTFPVPTKYTDLITTVAGTGSPGFDGDSKEATSASLFYPNGVAVDTYGNIYIADYNNNRVRKVFAEDGTIKTIAGTGLNGFNGDDIDAVDAHLSLPMCVVADKLGNIYICDFGNNRVRKVSALTGIITTVAGTESDLELKDTLRDPVGIAVDGSGNVYIADKGNNRVVKVSASSGKITTVAGGGMCGYNGDGIKATAAQLHSPYDVAVDAHGNIFIADRDNRRVRKVTKSTGIISTVTGTGMTGAIVDDIPAITAHLFYPSSVAVDKTGNLYIGDFFDNRVRKVRAHDGIITAIAGTGENGFNNDNIAATDAHLSSPTSVAVDQQGNIYIAEQGSNRIRKVTQESSAPEEMDVSMTTDGIINMVLLIAMLSLVVFIAVTGTVKKKKFKDRKRFDV